MQQIRRLDRLLTEVPVSLPEVVIYRDFINNNRSRDYGFYLGIYIVIDFRTGRVSIDKQRGIMRK